MAIRARALILLPFLLVLPALAVGGAGRAGAASRPPVSALPDATPLQVTLSLKPRHPRLLERLAAASTARPPLAPRVVRDLFLPGPADVARVRASMAASGLSLVAEDALSLTFAGDAGAAERAFGVSLESARAADGTRARAVAGAPQPPASIAPLVQDVSGLDTRAQLQPAASGSAAPASVPCSGAVHSGGYLPSQLGSSGGYDFSSLVSGGYSGGGERVAVVAFSNYKPSDVARYQTCFGTSVPVTDRAVSGGTSDRSGSDEVSLDVETVLSTAPGLDALHVYIARPTGTMAQVVNAIVSDAPSTGVRIISDSWGICEPALSPARAAATNEALQLAAVSGITFLAASGDTGSFDCGGFGRLAVDDPAAQQFATGVGGTNLHLGTAGSRHEVVWNDLSGAGGGGLSRFWSRPSWQSGNGVHSRFSNGNREVPDVSLHASPQQHGYPIYCTTGVCGGAGWQTVGGTSAGAPLLAGMVADMNQYSLAHGGHRLGYANPFLYDRFANDPAAFRDIVRGNNNLDGAGRYPATAGYDMATGIGAPLAAQLAADLAAYTPSSPALATTAITARPTRDRTIRYGQSVRLHGTLTAGGSGVARATVYVQGGSSAGIREWRLTTDGQGRWSLTLRHQLTRKMRWRAVFLGSQHRTPAVSARHTIFVRPPLTASVKSSSVRAGRPFRLHGRTLPALAGRPVAAEVRRRGGRWHRVGPAGVRVSGRFGRTITLRRAGRFQVRWHYHGHRSGTWLSSVSPPVTVRVG